MRPGGAGAPLRGLGDPSAIGVLFQTGGLASIAEIDAVGREDRFGRLPHLGVDADIDLAVVRIAEVGLFEFGVAVRSEPKGFGPGEDGLGFIRLDRRIMGEGGSYGAVKKAL